MLYISSADCNRQKGLFHFRAVTPGQCSTLQIFRGKRQGAFPYLMLKCPDKYQTIEHLPRLNMKMNYRKTSTQLYEIPETSYAVIAGIDCVQP
jgi:hypothetical protein